jgi:serine/threonine protein kinase
MGEGDRKLCKSRDSGLDEPQSHLDSAPAQLKNEDLILELVPGEDLLQSIRVSDLVGRSALGAGRAEYIPSQGFVYRDLKPENIMVLPSVYLKKIDLGFVKQSGLALGSAEHMAPEVILRNGHALTSRVVNLRYPMFTIGLCLGALMLSY